MKINFTKTLTAVTVVGAVAGLTMVMDGGAASAFGTIPPWVSSTVFTATTGDANELGGLQFFNAAGTQVTGGNLTDAPFSAYVVGTTVINPVNTKATVFGYLPNNGAAPGAWSGEALTASTTYPNAAYPGALGTTSLPVEKGQAADLNLANLAQDLPNTSSAAGYTGVYELRMKTTSAGSAPTKYDFADITLANVTTDGTGAVTGGTWSVTYTPDPTGTATTTTIDASTPTTATDTQTVTLKADVSPTAAGTVQFFKGTTALGTPQTVSAGVATLGTTLPAGTDQINATFTPAALSGFAGSSSANYPIVVTHVVANTTVTPSHQFGTYVPNPDSSVPAFTPTTLTATVAPATAGSVVYLDNGAQIGSGSVSASGVGTFVYNNFGPGTHVITETFTPTDTVNFTGSTTPAGSADNFTLGAAAGATPDVQPISADIPAGTLAISTPYAQNPGTGQLGPLNVTLALNAAGTALTGTAPFGDTTGTTADPLAHTIKIVDTRTGGLNWTASALASALSKGVPASNINAQNVGLVGLVADPIAGNHLTAANTTVVSNPAAGSAGSPDATPVTTIDSGTTGLGGPTAHAIAASNDSVLGGTGTIGFTGTLQINAPTSTPAGHYTGTITFTVA
jgi:hypothetical protein